MRATTLAIMVSLALTAGCAKKRSAESLPPAPASAAESAAVGTTPEAGVGSDSVPGPSASAGTREEFIREAGSDRVGFAYDSYELDGGARGVLDGQARWLGRNDRIRLTIEGHADERGTREYNLALGERRAIAIRNYLAANGVAAARIATISYGKERPEVEGSDEESYAQNRRGVTVLGAGAAS